jgi:hypothetical protein
VSVHQSVRGPGGRARCHSIIAAIRGAPLPWAALLMPTCARDPDPQECYLGPENIFHRD